MSSLEEIRNSVLAIHSSLTSEAAQLTAKAQWCQQQTAIITNSIEGSARNEYRQIIGAFQSCITILQNAVTSISSAINSLEEWADGRFGGIHSDMSQTTKTLSSPLAENSVFELNETPRFSEVNENFIAAIPKSRQNAIDMAYRKAPKQITDEINKYSTDLCPIADTGYSIDRYGRKVKDGCYYSPDDRQVRMDETLDDDEYAEIVPHEMSHFLDHERGWESRSSAFVDAMKADLVLMDRSTLEGRMRFNEMLDDAFNTGAAYDRNISDIINGMFYNDPEIINRFLEEVVPRYTHSDQYWATPFMREAETYANTGAVLCSANRISNNFLERYFPNTYAQFKTFYCI